MTTTIMIILFMIAFFVALFYLTHRDEDEIDASADESLNEGQRPNQINQTAKSMLTGALSGVNELRSQVSDSFTEMDLKGLPNLPQNKLDLKSMKIWSNGDAAHGTNGSSLEGNQTNEGQGAATEGAPLTERFSEVLNEWSPLTKQKNLLPQKFKEWTEKTHFAKRVKRIPEGTRAMKGWLNSLEIEENEVLIKQISEFASDLNFEFSWLLDEDFDKDKELKRDLEEVIVLYCLANFKGLLLQDELNTFIMFKAWLEDPTRKEYNDLNQKLFTTLVEKGLTDGVPSDLLLANETERSEYAIQAIHKVLEADRKAFKRILKDVLLASEIEKIESVEQEPLNEKEKNDIEDKIKQPS